MLPLQMAPAAALGGRASDSKWREHRYDGGSTSTMVEIELSPRDATANEPRPPPRLLPLKGRLSSVRQLDDDVPKGEPMTPQGFSSVYRELPHSCRAFLIWSTTMFAVTAIHGMVAFMAGTVTESSYTEERANLMFYGLSQILLATLLLFFAISCLVKENGVEIRATWTLGSLLILIEGSLLFNLDLLQARSVSDVLWRDAARVQHEPKNPNEALSASCASLRNLTSNVTNAFFNASFLPSRHQKDIAIVNALTEPGLRCTFLAVLAFLLLGMIATGRRANRDFGWRIFKKCGTNAELKKAYDSLYTLAACLKLDAALTIQMIMAGSFYLVPAYENDVISMTIAGLASITSCAWITAAFIAVHKEQTWFFRSWLSLGLSILHPAYLLYTVFDITYHETCRRSCCEWAQFCSLCPSATRMIVYKHLWEVPLIVCATISTLVRVFGTLRLLRRVSIYVLGKGAKLRTSNRPWHIPIDLKPFLQQEASLDALKELVVGSYIHIEHMMAGPLPDGLSQRSSADQGQDHVVEGGARPSLQRVLTAIIELCTRDRSKALSKLRGWLSALWAVDRRHQMVSGHCFFQMSEDLSTLRWSWNDFILVHEIATKPVGYDESKLIEVVHGPSDSRMVLRLRLASETLYNAWLTGLQALYSVAQRMEYGEDNERRKLDWLLMMFRQADTSNPGLVRSDQLRPLFQYLNYDLPADVEEAEVQFLTRVGGAAARWQIGTPRLGGREVTRKLHFREFHLMVQRLTIMSAVLEYARLLPSQGRSTPFTLAESRRTSDLPNFSVRSSDPSSGETTKKRRSGRKRNDFLAATPPKPPSPPPPFSLASVSEERSNREKGSDSSPQHKLRRGQHSGRQFDALSACKLASISLSSIRISPTRETSYGSLEEVDAGVRATPCTDDNLHSIGPSTWTAVGVANGNKKTSEAPATSSAYGGIGAHPSTVVSCTSRTDTKPSSAAEGTNGIGAETQKRVRACDAVTDRPPIQGRGCERHSLSLAARRGVELPAVHAEPGRFSECSVSRPSASSQGDRGSYKAMGTSFASLVRAQSSALESLFRSVSGVFVGVNRLQSTHKNPPPSAGPIFDERQVVNMLRLPELQGASEEFSPAFIRRFEQLAGTKRKLDVVGLQRLLLSNENELFAPHHRFVDESSLNMPLTDYFIASSHNSYLTGDQYRSDSDTRMYEVQLLQGCRCLEIDCWDGRDGEPEVKHGRTLTSAIKFRDVIVSIERYSFVTSPYPVILSFEMHCSLAQQDKIAEHLQRILGSKLHLPLDEQYPTRGVDYLPSPNQLQYKVLVKGRTLEDDGSQVAEGGDDDQMSEEDMSEAHPNVLGAREAPADFDTHSDCTLDEASDSAVGCTVTGPKESQSDSSAGLSIESQLSPGGRMYSSPSSSLGAGVGVLDGSMRKISILCEKDILKNHSPECRIRSRSQSDPPMMKPDTPKGRRAGRSHKKPTSKLLSDVTAISGKRFKNLLQPPAAQKERIAGEMASIGEAKALKLLADGRAFEWAQHTTQQLSRLYPRGRRVESSNYDPTPFWNCGVQMTALNYQTYDLPMQINNAKFMCNGGCGYVLKPRYLRLPSNDGCLAKPTTLEPSRPHETPSLDIPLIFHVIRIQPLGALHIPTPGEARGNMDAKHFSHFIWWNQPKLTPVAAVIDPFISVEVYGGRFACATCDREVCQHGSTWQSSAVPRNGMNPRWTDEQVEVITSHPELAQMVISICYRPAKARVRVLATAALPVSCLRGGVRSVQMLDEHGAPILFCKLLVRATIDKCFSWEVPASGALRSSEMRSSWSTNVMSRHGTSGAQLGLAENSTGESSLASSISSLRLVVPWVNKWRRKSLERSSRFSSGVPPIFRTASGMNATATGSKTACKSPLGSSSKSLESDPEPAEPLIPQSFGVEASPQEGLPARADHQRFDMHEG